MAKKVAKKTADTKASKAAGTKAAAATSKKVGTPEPLKSKKAKAAPIEEEKVLPQMTPNEEETDEDIEEATASRSAAPNASAVAAAAATAPTAETSAAFKNFRHHPDMENFYRFIYENDLRYEALQILDEVIVEKRAKRAAKLKKPH